MNSKDAKFARRVANKLTKDLKVSEETKRLIYLRIKRRVENGGLTRPKKGERKTIYLDDKL